MSKKKVVIAGIGLLIILGVYATSPSGEKYAFENNKITKIMQLKNQKQLDGITAALKSTEIDPEKIKAWKVTDRADPNGRKYYSFSTDGKGYSYGLWLNPNFTVHSVMYSGVTLYEEGKVLEKITDNIPTEREMQHMQKQVEKVVKANLKAPSTAKFSNFKFRKIHGVGIVSGFVDAQNSFGAMIRTPFSASFDFKQNGTMTKVEIDGNELEKD